MNNKHLKAANLFRRLFYMPYIVPFVAAVFLWGGMLNSQTDWINRFLVEILHVSRNSVPQWANSGAEEWGWIYATYVMMGVWGIGNAMLIMLAGLQGVPTELYDAAKVDGANSWQTFWKVTFPMISPVIFYNLTLSIVGLFQYFLVPLVVNQGAGRPGGFTRRSSAAPSTSSATPGRSPGSPARASTRWAWSDSRCSSPPCTWSCPCGPHRLPACPHRGSHRHRAVGDDRHLLVWYLARLSMVNLVYGSFATTIVVLLTLEAAAVSLLFGAQVIAEVERARLPAHRAGGGDADH